MRKGILIVAAIVSSGWLGACSKPTASSGQSADSKLEKGSRQIELAEPARAEGAVVSDLEAGRVSGRALVQTRKGSQPARVVRGAALAGAALDRAVTPTAASLHAMNMTPNSMPEAALKLAAAPLPPAPAPAPVTEAAAPEVGEYTGIPRRPVSDTFNRPGTIIIRGGPGGPDDDCDLRHGHRTGMAVNRLAPPMGGGRFRGGIR